LESRLASTTTGGATQITMIQTTWAHPGTEFREFGRSREKHLIGNPRWNPLGAKGSLSPREVHQEPEGSLPIWFGPTGCSLVKVV